MDSKKLAVIIVFAALTIALNLSSLRIPAPYALYLWYQIWEIPIVAAFLLFGVYVGTSISILNTAVLLGLSPGMLPTGPFYNLAAVLLMLTGIYIADKLFTNNSKKKQGVIFTIGAIVLGIIFRVVGMTVVNWTFLPFPPPVGFGQPVEAVIVALPLIGFFNATLALYTIPTGQILARAVGSSMTYFGWTKD